MKNLFLIVVCFFAFFTTSAQQTGVLSGDTLTLMTPRTRTITKTVVVDKTEKLTADAVDSLQRTLDDQLDDLSNSIREDDQAQNRIADYLETSNTERWRWYEVLGFIALGLLGLWGVLNALELNRVQVQVQNPNPPVPVRSAPTNDEIRAIVLKTLGEGDYFQSSAYAAPKGIAVKAGGNVTIVTTGGSIGGGKKKKRKFILPTGTTTPAPDAAPQGGNQNAAPAAAGSQEQSS
jgi:hypothetical protein